MELKIFALYDEKAITYARPFFLPHKGQAIRLFSDLATDSSQEIGRHPEDYSLYHLGTYDDITGRFENLQVPEFISRASEFKNPKISITKEVNDERKDQEPLPISEAVRSSVSGSEQDETVASKKG